MSRDCPIFAQCNSLETLYLLFIYRMHNSGSSTESWAMQPLKLRFKVRVSSHLRSCFNHRHVLYLPLLGCSSNLLQIRFWWRSNDDNQWFIFFTFSETCLGRSSITWALPANDVLFHCCNSACVLLRCGGRFPAGGSLFCVLPFTAQCWICSHVVSKVWEEAQKEPCEQTAPCEQLVLWLTEEEEEEER